MTKAKQVGLPRMKGTRRAGLAGLLVTVTLPCLAPQAAAPVPLNLPRPDCKQGNPAKPVKVYILAGQSNMVGIGGRATSRP